MTTYQLNAHGISKELFTQGNLSLLAPEALPVITIIGTRHCTVAASKRAHRISALLASHGYPILSGLAEGIDTAAHHGALHAHGNTIAVMGTPLSRIFPRENTELALRIVSEGGLLLTEYDDESQVPMGRRFIERDFIQAALSHLVIPVMGDMHSGTRHCVYYALDHGIPVFVPVPPAGEEEGYELLHSLIKDHGCPTFYDPLSLLTMVQALFGS